MILGWFHSELWNVWARGLEPSAAIRHSILELQNFRNLSVSSKLKQKLLSTNLRPLVPKLGHARSCEASFRWWYQWSASVSRIPRSMNDSKTPRNILPKRFTCASHKNEIKGVSIWHFGFWFLVDSGRLISSPWKDSYHPTNANYKWHAKSSEVKSTDVCNKLVPTTDLLQSHETDMNNLVQLILDILCTVNAEVESEVVTLNVELSSLRVRNIQCCCINHWKRKTLHQTGTTCCNDMFPKSERTKLTQMQMVRLAFLPFGNYIEKLLSYSYGTVWVQYFERSWTCITQVVHATVISQLLVQLALLRPGQPLLMYICLQSIWSASF